MDWFWVLVLGGLAYWFHARLKAVDARILQLSLNYQALADRLRSLEPGSPAMQRATAPVEPAPAPAPAPAPKAVTRPAEPASVPKVARAVAAPMAQVWPEDRAGSDAPKPAAAKKASWRPSFDFEDIFGRLLPIWGGGIALAIAGFFLVRWSIETGLLNEYVRVSLGFVFGLGLTAAAELAHRFSARLADDRVRQALAGAGIATLYASFYLAGAQYGLIAPAIAFIGMAGVTALAIALSFRFGLPSAILGLVGGFATPVLAGGSDPNLPVLATYLALVTGGLAYTGQKQDRPWLSLAALAGGLGWGALMLVSGPAGDTAIAAVGGYLVMVGALLPSLMGRGALGTVGRIAAAALAIVQIAALIATSGYALLAWGAYLLVAAALAVLGWRNHRLREAGAVAAGIAVCLLAAWPAPAPGWYAAIAAACALLFAALPLAHIWREDAAAIDWAKLAAFPLLLTGAICVQWQVLPIEMQNPMIAVIAAGLAILPASGAWLAWPREGEEFSTRSLASLTSALTLLWLGGMLAAPMWAAPLVNAAIAGLAFAVLHARKSPPVAALRWCFAAIGVLVLLGTTSFSELGQIIQYQPSQPEWLYALRWMAAAMPFALTALSAPGTLARRVAQIALAVIAYGAVSMLVPAQFMPLALLAGIALLAWRMPQRSMGMAVWLGFAILWASLPVAQWLAAGSEALMGDPVYRADLPALDNLAKNVLPLLGALLTGLVLHARLMIRAPLITAGLAAGLVLIIGHTLFKSVLTINDLDRFVALGLAERTLWQGLLAATGIAMAQLPQKFSAQRMTGYALAALALAHFAGFTLLLHNPLTSAQAVGAWPLVNLLLPAYGIAIGVLVWLRGVPAGRFAALRSAFDSAVMVLAALLALSQLRHGFAGTLLNSTPVGASEDLLRSLLAILLALAYLGWGAWRKQRSWRIGSLVLMLGAVGKVFLFDAAGLEGLARIASFMALGLCLIGIGWFYTRQLRAMPQPEAKAQQEAEA